MSHLTIECRDWQTGETEYATGDRASQLIDQAAAYINVSAREVEMALICSSVVRTAGAVLYLSDSQTTGEMR